MKNICNWCHSITFQWQVKGKPAFVSCNYRFLMGFAFAFYWNCLNADWRLRGIWRSIWSTIESIDGLKLFLFSGKNRKVFFQYPERYNIEDPRSKIARIEEKYEFLLWTIKNFIVHWTLLLHKRKQWICNCIICILWVRKFSVHFCLRIFFDLCRLAARWWIKGLRKFPLVRRARIFFETEIWLEQLRFCKLKTW